MKQFDKQIEIDFEVFKGLTGLLETEADTYNNVIRRLLKLPATANGKQKAVGSEWVSKGYSFPEGTKFRAIYKGKAYFAEIRDGDFVYDGTVYRSFSAAARVITNTPRNGWDFWEQQLPGQTKWKALF